MIHAGMMKATARMNEELDAAGVIDPNQREAANVRACRLAGAISRMSATYQQGLPVRLDRAPQRGAAFALRARTRSIGSRSRASRSRARGSSLIFNHPPAVARPPSPGPAHYLVARDHRLPALRHVHLLMNVLDRDVLVSARSLALEREQALLIDGSP